MWPLRRNPADASIFLLNFEPIIAKKEYLQDIDILTNGRQGVSVDTRTGSIGQTLGFHGELIQGN